MVDLDLMMMMDKVLVGYYLLVSNINNLEITYVQALVVLASVVSGAPDPYILYNTGLNYGLRTAYPHPYFHYSQPGDRNNNQQSDLLNLLTAIYSTQPYVLTPVWSNNIMAAPQPSMMAVDTDTAPIVEAKDSAYTTSFTTSNSDKEDSRPKYFTVSNRPENLRENQ